MLLSVCLLIIMSYGQQFLLAIAGYLAFSLLGLRYKCVCSFVASSSILRRKASLRHTKKGEIFFFTLQQSIIMPPKSDADIQRLRMQSRMDFLRKQSDQRAKAAHAVHQATIE